MNIKQYFTSQFLFQINSAHVSPSEKVFLFAGFALVLLAIVMKLASKFAPTPIDSRFRKKFFSLFLTVGISQIVWYGCRYQNIQFFGSNFVAMIIVLIALAWLIFLLVSMFRKYKAEKSLWEKDQLKLKYLPK